MLSSQHTKFKRVIMAFHLNKEIPPQSRPIIKSTAGDNHKFDSHVKNLTNFNILINKQEF